MCINVLTDQALKEKIALQLADYQNPPNGGMSIPHVTRWVEQFQLNDRRFILEETHRIMESGYLSAQKYHELVDELIEDDDNIRIFENAAFLNIQIQGVSQNEFIDSLREGLADGIHVVTRNSQVAWVQSFQEFVYVDDVSFSGAKVINDLTWLINHFQLQNITVCVHLMGYHTYAEWNIKHKIEKDFNHQKITILISGGTFRCVENRASYCEKSGVFWPNIQSVITPPAALNATYYIGLYRNGYIKNVNFPDESRRDRFESILTSTGFSILGNSVNPSSVIKPLGFSTFNGVGFGGTTFTYRNCPNNTPLAFWWGTYEPTGNQALDCWYPLMKRIVYNR